MAGATGLGLALAFLAFAAALGQEDAFSVPSGGTKTPSPLFSSQAWRAAPDPHAPNWSREAMVKPLMTEHDLKGMTRQQVISLLGVSGFADETYYDGHGLAYRIDLYRLSAKNDKSLRVDYDGSEDKVTEYNVESAPCACPDCTEVGPDKTIQMEILNQSVLAKHPETSDAITISQLEGRLGRAGQHESMINQVGGQAWVNYDDIWHIAGSDGRFFFASGHLARTQWKSFEDARILTYSVVSLTLECLTPKQTN